jgi:multidrug efflux pump subunit AcrB
MRLLPSACLLDVGFNPACCTVFVWEKSMNMNDDDEKAGRAGHFFAGAMLGALVGMILAGVLGFSHLAIPIIIASILVVGVLGAKFGDRMWIFLVLSVVALIYLSGGHHRHFWGF